MSSYPQECRTNLSLWSLVEGNATSTFPLKSSMLSWSDLGSWFLRGNSRGRVAGTPYLLMHKDQPHRTIECAGKWVEEEMAMRESRKPYGGKSQRHLDLASVSGISRVCKLYNEHHITIIDTKKSRRQMCTHIMHIIALVVGKTRTLYQPIEDWEIRKEVGGGFVSLDFLSKLDRRVPRRQPAKSWQPAPWGATCPLG